MNETRLRELRVADPYKPFYLNNVMNYDGTRLPSRARPFFSRFRRWDKRLDTRLSREALSH